MEATGPVIVIEPQVKCEQDNIVPDKEYMDPEKCLHCPQTSHCLEDDSQAGTILCGISQDHGSMHIRPEHKTLEPNVSYKEADFTQDLKGNVLTIRLQPDEGINLSMTIKEPGPGGMRLTEVPLDMTFAEVLGDDELSIPDAYERLIMDVIRGNQTLFMRGDEVEAAWAWVDPIIKNWEENSLKPAPYDAGSNGPDDSLMLMHKDGRRWREIEK